MPQKTDLVLYVVNEHVERAGVITHVHADGKANLFIFPDKSFPLEQNSLTFVEQDEKEGKPGTFHMA